jgi:hypothetical protein
MPVAGLWNIGRLRAKVKNREIDRQHCLIRVDGLRIKLRDQEDIVAVDLRRHGGDYRRLQLSPGHAHRCSLGASTVPGRAGFGVVR